MQKIFLLVKITLDNADKNQSDLLNDFIDFKRGTNQRNIGKKMLKRDTIESINSFWNCS